MYPYFEKISDNFFYGDNKRVAGFGIIKHPEIAKVRWCIVPD